MVCKVRDFTLQAMAHTNHKFPVAKHRMLYNYRNLLFKLVLILLIEKMNFLCHTL